MKVIRFSFSAVAPCVFYGMIKILYEVVINLARFSRVFSVPVDIVVLQNFEQPCLAVCSLFE